MLPKGRTAVLRESYCCGQGADPHPRPASTPAAKVVLFIGYFAHSFELLFLLSLGHVP